MAQDDPDFSPLNGVRPGIYGCGGQNRDVGHGNPDGYWSTGPYTITGAMWLDCGQHPLDTIRRAFRFDPRETLTTIVLSIFRVYGISRTGNGMGQCNVPRRRRARGVEPRAGDEVTTQVEQLPDDMVINAAEDEKMGGQNGTGTGVGRQLLDSQRPRYEWRFPDIIEVGGVSYSDKGRGDLLYVNAAGEQLKLFGHVEHHRRKKEPSLEPEQEPEKKKPDHAEDGF
ncbi:MAG: hypothetical protein M1832_004613 [Thelocarpon impressellum]|nr:MAG: hypothetical protein M1832_004613 [Thelocarpon impressellum]